ncbi:FAD-dependent oxidoreductase [Candidatus Gracilibacteria bacterium]|nr:FAD-dependent oxidoreductase [Candidatus Gracilibacteria bacterium]
MRPLMQKYILKNIKKLTLDVFELDFEGENELKIIPGQFITFMIDGIGARAYSILEKDGKNLKFIIKKVELKEGGRGGSKYLCEMEVGAELKGIGASGHFVFRENNLNKVFFATGTGFVPIFFQIKNALEKGFSGKIKFVFGVRFEKDLFYLEELENLKNIYKNFDFTIYLSREKSKIHKIGYISDEIKYLKNNFEEAYICGNSEVVDSVKKILLKNDFDERNIFEEKY